MPKFPIKEADIIALANAMIAGYAAHRVDFPNANLRILRSLRGWYLFTSKFQFQVQAAAYLATRAKHAKLIKLKEVMKNCLRRSEVDVAGDIQKLAQIGWGSKAKAQPIEAPGQPNNLCSIARGRGEVRLKWDRSTSGGAIRNYIIQRRCQAELPGKFTSWTLVQIAFDTQINLNNQPTGSQLEYRIKAANTAGESTPSNTVAVVL